MVLPGRTQGYLRRNGAGKTILIRMLLGLPGGVVRDLVATGGRRWSCSRPTSSSR
jgi:ABC-type uncharacterized transport system ATPase subunit